MTSGINNRFTVFFGVKNPSNAQISPALEARGIPLLRQEPDKANITVLPDARQPGYMSYANSLPHFMRAYMLNMKINLLRTCAVLLPTVWENMTTWGLPSLVFGWKTAIATEVLDDLRETRGASDTTGQGRPGMVLSDPTFDDVKAVRETHPDPTFPAPFGMTNLTTIPTVLLVYRIANQFISLQQYSAFLDTEHFEGIVEGLVEDPQSDDVQMRPEQYIPEIGTVGGVIKVPERVTQQVTCLKGLEPYGSYNPLLQEDTVDTGGLWFPYLSELALFDTDTIPRVIDRWFLGCLAEEPSEVTGVFQKIKSDMGLLGRTEWGKTVTHLFRCIDVAIRAQAKVKIAVESGHYLGCAVMGSNFTIHVNGTEYRPGGPGELKDAYLRSGSNVEILHAVALAAGLDFGTISAVKGMWELRGVLSRQGVPLGKQKDVIRIAKQLRFPEKHWTPVVANLTKAKNLLVDGTPLAEYPDDTDLPIVADAIFSLEKDFVIWSCFGYVAPSFRIPGGASFDLTARQNLVSRRAGVFGGGKTNEQLVVSKISLQMVALDVAVDHLRALIREQKALNPFAQPNTRRSMQNQYKTFTGKDFQRVVEILREIAKVGAPEEAGPSKGKRKAGGEPDETRPSKRTALDW